MKFGSSISRSSLGCLDYHCQDLPLEMPFNLKKACSWRCSLISWLDLLSICFYQNSIYPLSSYSSSSLIQWVSFFFQVIHFYPRCYSSQLLSLATKALIILEERQRCVLVCHWTNQCHFELCLLQIYWLCFDLLRRCLILRPFCRNGCLDFLHWRIVRSFQLRYHTARTSPPGLSTRDLQWFYSNYLYMSLKSNKRVNFDISRSSQPNPIWCQWQPSSQHPETFWSSHVQRPKFNFCLILGSSPYQIELCSFSHLNYPHIVYLYCPWTLLSSAHRSL